MATFDDPRVGAARRIVAFALACALVATGAFFLDDAKAQTASTSASASAPSPSGSAVTPPEPPMIRGSDVPTARSEVPTAAEWKTARKVSIERHHYRACTTDMVREYLRVRCADDVGAAVFAGDAKDARAVVEGRMGWNESFSEREEIAAIVIVPLRRGEASLASFRDLSGMGPYMSTYGSDANLVVSWRDDEADPLVVLTYTPAPPPFPE